MSCGFPGLAQKMENDVAMGWVVAKVVYCLEKAQLQHTAENMKHLPDETHARFVNVCLSIKRNMF